MNLPALAIMVLCTLSLSAQMPFSCVSKELIDYRNQQFPGYSQAVEATFEDIRERAATAEPVRAIYTIPVVVHVVYHTASQNLPDSVIHNQIAVLNAAFARLNADTVTMRSVFQPIVGATQIRFSLAVVDPNGDATTGITRTETSLNTFFGSGDMDDFERVKSSAEGGKDPWDTDRYMNLWVCNISEDAGYGIGGYATPPLGLPNWPSGSFGLVDGVVVHYTVTGSNSPVADPTGSFTEGLMAVHEVGHYLGLRHIWGDGSDCTATDGIPDTPPASYPSFNDCDLVKNTCMDNIAGTNMPDMVENYMDYSAESCRNSFTKGQRDFMHAVLDDERYELTHDNPALETDELILQASCYPNPTAGLLTIKSINPMQQLNLLNVNGREVFRHQAGGTMTSIELPALPSGVYLLQIHYANGLQSRQRIAVVQ